MAAAVAYRIAPVVAVSAASIVTAAMLVQTPPASVVVAILGAAAVAVAFAAPAHVALPLALAVLATFQLSQLHPFALGPANVYSTDLLLGLVVGRALIPRPRFSARVGWRAILPFAIPWALVMAYAGLVGRSRGLTLDSLIRLEMSLIYLPLLIVGFGALMRERNIDLRRLAIGCALVTAALIGWMLVARATGRTFETVNQLGRVITSGGDYLRRDYGFSSAFIVYPLAACAAYAHLSHAPRRERWVLGLMILATAATLLTLIRGEIYGLIAGCIVITFVGRGWIWQRVRAVAVVAVYLLLVLLAVAAISPAVARGVIERTIPDLGRQSSYAQQTAEFRFKALEFGRDVASEHPHGIGLQTESQLTALGIPSAYLAHSSIAWLLVYTGWIGLICAVVAFASLFALSFRAPGNETWLHPGFVGVMAVLAVYSFGAAGLLAQPWVIGVAALCVAVRFYAPFAQEKH